MSAAGIAPKGSEKYIAQCWAGLVDDPAAVAGERQRRAAETHARRTREQGAKQADAMGRADAAGMLVNRD